MLVGRAGDRSRHVVRVVPRPNVHPGDRLRAYTIDPAELLAQQKASRAEGLEIVGYYHSHPDSEAVPSRSDRETAWPHVSYLIVGLDGARVRQIRSWAIESSGGRFEEEAVQYERA